MPLSKARKKAMDKMLKAESTPTPTPSVEYMDPKMEAEIRAKTPSPMDAEGIKRANEPTGAWRKRQGLGKPKWYESEY